MHEAPRTNPVFGAFFVLFWNKSAKSRQKSKTKKPNPLFINELGYCTRAPNRKTILQNTRFRIILKNQPFLISNELTICNLNIDTFFLYFSHHNKIFRLSRQKVGKEYYICSALEIKTYGNYQIQTFGKDRQKHLET